MKTTPRERTWLRAQAGLDAAQDRTPVEVVPGTSPPLYEGSGWHYETRGGRVISSPSAYSKRGWSNMIYCASTARVVVGATWLANARRRAPLALTRERPTQELV